MLKIIYQTILYQPLRSGLLFLSSVMPGGDLGLSIIALTFVVRAVLFPLTQKSIRTQAKMKALESKITDIKSRFKNKEEQAKKIMELYRQEKVNPFSGILVLLVQIPIIFALYHVFLDSSALDSVNTMFLGIVDLTQKNIPLAVLAGVTQFFQAQLAMPAAQTKEEKEKPGFAADFKRSMHLQVKYFMPIMVVVIAATIPSAVVLYWVASNIFMIAQELLFRRKKEELLKPQNPQG